MSENRKRRMGRPPLPMPDPIPDTPENPKGGWNYIKEHKARQQTRKRKKG